MPLRHRVPIYLQVWFDRVPDPIQAYQNLAVYVEVLRQDFLYNNQMMGFQFELFVDGQSRGSWSASNNGFEWFPLVAPNTPGKHTITVRFLGNSDYEPASQSLTFNVVNPLPIVEPSMTLLTPLSFLAGGLIILALSGGK